jgi:CubicO group peptidase (beta-lactamase class C family)
LVPQQSGFRGEDLIVPAMTSINRRAVLKGLAAGSACIFGDLAAAPSLAAERARLRRSDPESLGIDPAAIAAFVDAVEQQVGGLHGMMLLRRGQVAAEGWWAPYAPEHPHMLYSLSKSFTSTAVGLAVAEGRLTVDARVTSFFPEDLPSSIGPNLRAMRVRHLLAMATGHERDATNPTTRAEDGNWVKAFLSLPVEHEPGSRFVYNSAATYMLSAIVQKLTGQTVLEYLTPRLLSPLGIEGATWENDPRGINVGGWGLNVRTEDIARFGQLYLQRGKWNGRQLLPESWIAEATRKQVENGANPDSDWNQGYGYQFWRCRHGAYRGDGAFGQYCVVMPQQEAVLAITSGIRDMQAVLNAAWEHLLPGMASGSSSGENGALKRKLAALQVRAPEGKPTSPAAARVSGRTYRLDANQEKIESAAPTFRGSRCTLVLRDERGERRLVSDAERWVKGTAPMGGGSFITPARPEAKVAARGTWAADDTYVMKICFYETPYVETLTCKFTEDRVTITRSLNVSFGPTERPTLTGRTG